MGRWRSWFKSSSAPAIWSIAGRSRSSRRRPASVTDTLRVVRFNKRTLRRSSSCRIEWLSADGVTPSCDAAARKLKRSATATNAVRSARWLRSIAEFLSTLNAIDIAFSLASCVNMLVRRDSDAQGGHRNRKTKTITSIEEDDDAQRNYRLDGVHGEKGDPPF